MNKQVDVAIVGGGPAGLAAAISCHDHGIDNIILLERDSHLGGILQQCIHNGFGLHRFKEELTGPEYSQRFEDEFLRRHIPHLLNTMVMKASSDKKLVAVNPQNGVMEISAKAVIFATGCRERTRGALQIPGGRPSGVYTAGMAQRLVNLEGWMPGKEVVILGSGDIGLIMARRMRWEGANVKMVCEIMPYSTGLARNVRQCLDDYDIPLKFQHTVIKIHGKERLQGVTIARVDENRKPIADSEEFVDCDTLLLSVGLIPENELGQMMGVALDPATGGAMVNEYRHTNILGVFACGNALHVHDLVDYVSEEAEAAGEGAAIYLKSGEGIFDDSIPVIAGAGVRYAVPQRITAKKPVKIFFRVERIFLGKTIRLRQQDNVLLSKRFIKATPGELQEIELSLQAVKRIDSRENIVIEVLND